MLDNKDIEIYDVKVVAYSVGDNRMIDIHWNSNIGFGVYSLGNGDESKPWVGWSETMDRNDPNRSFLKMLLTKWAENVEVVE